MMDKMYQFIASIIPRKLLYFCVIQAWVYATTEKYTDRTPSEVSWNMTCKYLEKGE